MKIGIVNDMPMAVEALRRSLVASPEHQVIWVAENGAVAVARAAQQTPDLILMDLIMPVMDGVEATRRIMKTTPCQILVVTASVTGNSAKVFEAMGAGALDVVATPVLNQAEGGRALLEKIDRIARICGFRKRARPRQIVSPARILERSREKFLVAIGSSTGGPQALLEVLANFPRDFPAAVVVVQHMDEQFSNGLAQWLDRQVDVSVRIAREGDRPQPGLVLIPATGNHLIMHPNNSLGYIVEPRENFYHPSVDVFFESVARNWLGGCIGVILTGMGRDGAEGLLTLKRQGHYTIAQDEKSCVVFGMPKAAIELGATREVLPICAIGGTVIDLLAPGKGLYHG